METPSAKALLGSRTFWIGLGQIVAGIGPIMSGMVSEGLTQIMAGIGLITGRLGAAGIGAKKLRLQGLLLPMLVGLTLMTGCAAFRAVLGLDPGGADDAEATKTAGNAMIHFGGFLPTPFGIVIQIAGNAVSAIGAGLAHRAQKVNGKT